MRKVKMTIIKIDEYSTTKETIIHLTSGSEWYSDQIINPYFRLLQHLHTRIYCVDTFWYTRFKPKLVKKATVEGKTK